MGDRIELPRFESCFVCGDPRYNSSALELQAYLEDGTVRSQFTPGHAQCGYPGTVHGGILASLLDEISIWAASYAAEAFCVTRELRTQFLKPARPHQTLSLSAWVVEHDRLMTVEGTIEDNAGEVIARSVGHFYPADEEEWKRRVRPHLA